MNELNGRSWNTMGVLQVGGGSNRGLRRHGDSCTKNFA